VEYQSLSKKNTGSAEQALLTNHRRGTHVRRRHPNPPRWLRRSLYTAPHLCLPLVGCLPSSHATGTQRDKALAEASMTQYVCALIRRSLIPTHTVRLCLRGMVSRDALLVYL
uniref:Uncharacterized protein n=1 Tax=Mesocestoides corti TaxID=53468 RepID=A0A5K3FPF5_MESCO